MSFETTDFWTFIFSGDTTNAAAAVAQAAIQQAQAAKAVQKKVGTATTYNQLL